MPVSGEIVPLDDLPDELRPQSGQVVPESDLPDDVLEARKTSHPVLATAARIIPTIAGTALGTVIAPGVGTAVGGAIGGGLGERIAQLIEGRGTSMGQVLLNAALGAIPALNLGKGLGTAARVGIRAAEGAGMAGAGQAASNLIEGQPISEGLLPAFATGTALGAGGGLLERALLGGKAKAQVEPGTAPAGEVPLAKPAVAAAEQMDLPGLPGIVTQEEKLARIAELEAVQTQLRSDLEFKQAKSGTQRSFDLPEPDPMVTPPGAPLGPHRLDRSQLSELLRLSQTDSAKAIKYIENLQAATPTAAQVPTRTAELGANMLGVDMPDRSFWKSLTNSFNSSNTLLRTSNPWVLMAKYLGEESSKTVAKFGTAGTALVNRVRMAYDGFENQLAEALDGPQGISYLVSKKQLNLTPQERINLFDFMEGDKPALNLRVAQVGNIMKQQYQAIEQRATALGLEIRDPVSGVAVPWMRRENFMPHFTDWDAIAKDPSRQARAVHEIQTQMSQQRGTNVALSEAQDAFNRMRMNSRREYGHLEIARHFSLSDIERDAVVAHARYMEGALKRLNEAEFLGNRMEVAKGLVAAVGQETNDDMATYMARTYIEKVTGKNLLGDNTNPLGSVISGQLRTIQSGLKLGQAVIANSGQSVITDMLVGHSNLVKGFRDTLTKGGKEFGALAGATLGQTQRDMMETTGRGNFASAVLKYTGFTRVEQFNRMLAANAGKAFLHELVDKLRVGNPNQLNEIKRHLLKMDIDPMSIVAKNYQVGLDEELKAARSVISRTQFKVRPQDLPLFWSGPWGSLVTQFSSFGFKAGKAIKDELVKEAARGNFKPLARMLLVAPVAGEIIRDVQSITKGKGGERPDNVVERVADNIAGVGAWGLYYDAYQAASMGELGASRRLLGPTLSDVANLGSAAFTGDLPRLGRGLAQNVPVIGSPLRHALFDENK